MTVGDIATIGGFALTISGVFVLFGAYKNKLENIGAECLRYKEDHVKLHDREHDETREKFKELFESRNSQDQALVKLATLVEQIFKRIDSIDTKIDKALRE